ncbi:BTAD domain-containing putative transcriptional regulator [Nonomuraea sp. NPDC050328]|uniref:BTAD domain-containing putative transcriptional regulator n=1 Tax=Nonomuraea sp. NPDC050328 TaxID=3364361 RepID=UPI00379DA5F2
MRFGILGPLTVESASGEEVAVGGPRPRALLTMLLLEAGRVVPVERLIDGQYGDAPPAGAANALQAQVSRLRRHLPVSFEGTGYRLAVEPLDVDAHLFERLAGEGRDLLSRGSHSAAVQRLREALGLWRGPALPDLPFGAAQVARLEELRLSAVEDLAEATLALGAPTTENQAPPGSGAFGGGVPGLVAELGGLVAQHPLRERLAGLLMRALVATGRPAEALAVFEATRARLAAELGADPSPELAALHLSVLRAERPAVRGLPAQLTSFVGRAGELGGLGGERLVTLLGPGGVGKTRLAVEAAARDPREVCFADLSAVEARPPRGGSEVVALTVLGALGVREGGGFLPHTPAGPLDRLTAALAGRELLLVLDNCEHVIDAAAALARHLLAACPGLAILATSREPLGLTGEHLVPLAPLAAPPPGATPAEALAYPAVRLFADRAAAVRPGFEVTEANVEAVTEVCATLDGLPLALELAAARLRTFPVAELAARLATDGRFRLLSRGDRTASARHQTLRAAVEWSWSLLTPHEQELARRFSVFAGGASLEAAEALCGDIADLVDKSLVVLEGSGFRMFDTIRYFCAATLTDDVRAEHARYYLDLALRAEPHLRRAEQLDWLARLSAEHANLTAAMRHDPETGQRMVAALATYCWLSGRRGQVGEIAAGLLEPLPGLEEEYVACVLHAVPRASEEHWDRAAAIMRGMDRPLRHPFTAALWGMFVGPDGFGSPALLGGDDWNVALGRLSDGLVRVLGGEPGEGDRLLDGVLSRFRALGERWGMAQALDWQALVASWRGQWERAHELRAEALDLLEELGALEESADVLARRAETRVREGDPSAVADFQAADESRARAGQPPIAALGLARLARWSGDLDGARRQVERAATAAEGQGFGLDAGPARVLTERARIAGALGVEGDSVAGWHREAVALARQSPLVAELADAVEGLAEAVPAEESARLLGVAVALRGLAVAGDRDVAETAARARAALGQERFATTYAEAAALDREAALAAVAKAVDGEHPR